jgi:hypothetical protein
MINNSNHVYTLYNFQGAKKLRLLRKEPLKPNTAGKVVEQ